MTPKNQEIRKSGKREIGGVLLEGVCDAHALEEGAEMAGPYIGGRDVITELDEAGLLGRRVQVMLGVDRSTGLTTRETKVGQIGGDHGWPGSDVTPGEPPTLQVGDWSLLETLGEADGKTVALSVMAMPDQSLRGFAAWITSMDEPNSLWRRKAKMDDLIEEAKGALADDDLHRDDVTDEMKLAAFAAFVKHWNEGFYKGGAPIRVAAETALWEFEDMVREMLEAALKARHE